MSIVFLLFKFVYQQNFLISWENCLLWTIVLRVCCFKHSSRPTWSQLYIDDDFFALVLVWRGWDKCNQIARFKAITTLLLSHIICLFLTFYLLLLKKKKNLINFQLIVTYFPIFSLKLLPFHLSITIYLNFTLPLFIYFHLFLFFFSHHFTINLIFSLPFNS